jgi:hypothetical protein
MIEIRSKQHNFRRCGISHPKEAVVYPDGQFSKQDLAILKAEPMLVVKEIAAPDPADEAAKKAADSGKESAKPGKKGKR